VKKTGLELPERQTAKFKNSKKMPKRIFLFYKPFSENQPV
jgi:hypothetical protein